MNSPDLSQLEPLIEPTPEERRRAALAVCARATDVEDARMLLAMLGLDHESERTNAA